MQKSEDPAKMTYSIPDFVSSNAINTQYLLPFFSILRELGLNTQYSILTVNQINTFGEPYRCAGRCPLVAQPSAMLNFRRVLNFRAIRMPALEHQPVKSRHVDAENDKAGRLRKRGGRVLGR